MAVHGALLFAAVAHSLWNVDELSAASTPVFLGSLTPPPAPPPPPPAGGRKVSKVTRERQKKEIVQPDPKAIVQPEKEVEEDVTEPGEPRGVAGGQPGGTIGGVPGGEPGGVPGGQGVGPSPKSFVPPAVAKGQLAIDPQSDQYRVRLPLALQRAGVSVWALLRVCVNKEGRVEEVKMLKHADPAVDQTIIDTIKTWRYRPYTVDGRPVPFCTNVRYEISAI